MSRSPAWTIADLVDFEMLRATDPETLDPRLRSRLADRHPQPIAPGDPDARRRVFLTWLTLRREEAGTALPGAAITAGWRSLQLLGILAGGILGSSVTAALLHYKGNEPVNVSWFLLGTLGIQLALLLLAGVAGLLRTATGALGELHPLRRLLSYAAWLGSSTLRRLPGDQRDRLRVALAQIERKREIYGTLVTWPFLIVTQLVAVGYNTGILTVLLLHVATTDLAFGWQSTLQLSPDAAHRLVAVVATPWSWFAPNPYPSLAQIVGSRFAYSEGIARLDRGAMASWWPFLCYAIATYGLLFRSVLLILATWKLRTSLAALTFQHDGCNALFRRLTGPVVQAQEGTATLAIPAASSETTPPQGHAGDCLLLVSSDLEAQASLLAKTLSQTQGWRVVDTSQVQIDHPSGNAAALATVSSSPAQDAAVIVVVPARRSPIKAIALFLQKVVDAASPGREVILLLVGRTSDSAIAPVTDEDFRHWRNFQAIHGLRLTLERLAPP